MAFNTVKAIVMRISIQNLVPQNGTIACVNQTSAWLSCKSKFLGASQTYRLARFLQQNNLVRAY